MGEWWIRLLLRECEAFRRRIVLCANLGVAAHSLETGDDR